MTLKTYEKTTHVVTTVLNCAQELFHTFGYRKTTVDEIASCARISKRTLYDIFPSKEEMLREVAWRDTTDIVSIFAVSIPSGSQPDTILLSFCRYIFTDRIKKGKKGIFRGLHTEDSIIRTAYIDALKRVFKDIYDSGRDAGLFKPVEPFFATDAVVNIVTTALDHFHKTPEPVRLFNNAMTMIADAVAYRNRITFDRMG